MFKVKYTKSAENDLFEIYNYIAEDNDFIASKVIMKIKYTINILSVFPLSWKIIENNYRAIIESKHNYKIVYEFSKNTVYIISIFKYKNLW